jgi:glycosyltransferase involved in cell wall biosynthesis
VTSPAEAPTVLLLINTFDIGGAERVYLQLARGLAQRGCRVIAACLQVRSGRVASELQDSPVEVMDLHMYGKLDALVIARLARALRRERVSVLYTFLIHSHVIGRLAARLARTPVVLSSQQIMGWEGSLTEWTNRFTARWCTAVVGVSGNVTRYLIDRVGIPPDKVVTIYNCVDVSRFNNRSVVHAPRTGPVIGSIARLNAEKDHRTLLRAFAIVVRQCPAARLLLAGDGPEREPLEALAHELGVSHAVEFLGHVSDVRDVHARLDIYVQSSHVEGMPVAVLEALAAGLPVVAARVGGNEEAVIDRVCGLLVPPRDPQAMADAVRRLVDNPDEARCLGEAGRRHIVSRFGADAAVDATVQLIHRLLREAAAA